MAAIETKKTKKYLILASGGNAPGMGNCLNGFTKKCFSCGIEPWYAEDGYKGLVENKIYPCPQNKFQEFVNKGAIIIGSSRYPEFGTNVNLRKQAAENLKKNGIDAVVVMGGEGSYKGALALSEQGINVIAIPATIDNDVASTSYTIGFDTCLNQCSKFINDTCDCFTSHHGIAIVEIMGRECPDLTVSAGIGSNVHYMVTKYSQLDIPGFIKVAQNGFEHGKDHITILVTERMYGINGLPTLKDVAKAVEAATGRMTRHVAIGYVQRGGASSARDRLLANYFANHAVNILNEGKKNRAICRINKETIDIDLAEAISAKRKSMNKELVKEFNKINQF